MNKDKSNKSSANQYNNQSANISKPNLKIDQKNINNLSLNIPKINNNSKTNLNKSKSSNPKDDLLKLKENMNKNHDE